ncbi:hypothetical protein NPS55_16725 [Escherichia coli]|nr:hypothetical protein [Escherichia coli]MCQ6867479.1 hypothetical protein [Escherichia coli]
MANSSSRYSVLTAAHWGPMLVETDGETVFSSRGALATGMENSLQSAVRDQVHSNTRVRFPMVGEPAEFGKNRTLRFSGHP